MSGREYLRRRARDVLALLVAGWVGGPAGLVAQPVVPVGGGSYAEFPPAHEGPKPTSMVTDRPIYLTDDAPRPIPTNDWWTDLINQPFSGGLWAYPLTVHATERGAGVRFPQAWNSNGTEPERTDAVGLQGVVDGRGFVAVDARAKAWGDWTLTFRSADAAGNHIDFTLGRGLPYVWAEYSEGLMPSLALPQGAVFYDDRGRPLTAPFAADHVGVKCGDQHFGVYAPRGSRFGLEKGQLRVKFAGKDRTLVLAALPRAEDLKRFADHVYAIPRDSRYTWVYDPQAGTVTTRFTLETESLRPGKPAMLFQGFLPHHVRDTTHTLELDEARYFTPRGTLRMAAGETFEVTYRFAGMIPNYPTPTALEAHEKAPTLDTDRLADYVARYATRAAEYGGDTYWGGKDLVRLAKYMDLAFETGHPDAPVLRDGLRAALEDWLTYQPDEKERYFARYPNWGALVGFNESYGSDAFVDHHFHYGYFTLASAMLAVHDPSFLDDDAFGPMIRLVAQQYANWQRDDVDFPYLRTFDPWAGHSYAGGLSSPRGNNQESTSEAIQSWAGLFLLGAMLDDQDMRACGAMGLAVESRATLEYWFDFYGDNFSADYAHPIVGILFNSANAYATYFSGDPAWIHGIQWIPVHPVMDYLVADRDWARGVLRNMLAERKVKEGDDSISSMGAALGNVILGYELLFDPDAVARQMDTLWEAEDPVARDNYTGGLTYAYAHTVGRLGFRDSGVHFSEPTAAAYVREGGGGAEGQAEAVTTYVIYNPRAYPQLITGFRGEQVVGRVLVPGRTRVVTDTLPPVAESLVSGVLGSAPSAGAVDVGRRVKVIHAVFDQPLDAESLAGIVIDGPGAPGMRARLAGRQEVVELALDGRLEAGGTYTVTIPTSVRTAQGQPAVDDAFVWSFTLEPLPPLAVVGTEPANGAQRVALGVPEIVVEFNAVIDLATLKRVRLKGPRAPSLTPEIDPENPERVIFKLGGALQPDGGYTLNLPAGVAAGPDHRLGKAVSTGFATEPSPCPPNIYRDSFAGLGHSAEGGLKVDFASTDKPRSGSFEIKLVAGESGGTLSLYRGTAGHGEGRDPVDLSAYDRVEFYLRGDAQELYLKVGHPVFDEAFGQTRYTKMSPRYQRVTLDLPEGRGNINTLLVVALPAGATVYLDDIRLLKPGR